MNRRLRLLFAAAWLAACTAKSGEEATAPVPPREGERAETPVPAGGLAFVGRVWVVERSDAVAVGSTRIFLADGTLVLADPGSTPAFGRWSFEAGRLTVVEDDIAYPAAIEELRGDSLTLALHGPGEPVRMTLRDARGSSTR